LSQPSTDDVAPAFFERAAVVDGFGAQLCDIDLGGAEFACMADQPSLECCRVRFEMKLLDKRTTAVAEGLVSDYPHSEPGAAHFVRSLLCATPSRHCHSRSKSMPCCRKDKYLQVDIRQKTCNSTHFISSLLI